MSVLFHSKTLNSRGGDESRESVVFTRYKLLIIWKERQGKNLFSTPLEWWSRGLSKWRRTSAFAMAKPRESEATIEGIRSAWCRRVKGSAARRLCSIPSSFLSIRVHLEKEGKHYYYGNLKALTDHWPKDAIGVSYSYLKNLNISEEKPYRNDFCIICRGCIVTSSRHEKN